MEWYPAAWPPPPAYFMPFCDQATSASQAVMKVHTAEPASEPLCLPYHLHAPHLTIVKNYLKGDWGSELDIPFPLSPLKTPPSLSSLREASKTCHLFQAPGGRGHAWVAFFATWDT